VIAPCLMVQGTASGVGKSLFTTALCRIFARQGHRVAPFKAQNMSLNAAVTADGREIGRAQATQAEAAGVEPAVDMNPVLLKPEGDDRSQVVVRGVPIGSMTFSEYGRRRREMLAVIAGSLDRLRRTHDLVVIEGAGSPAEINLARGDVVNMRVARLAGAPVLLVGDIDRGGVFAALVGTLALLGRRDRARVRGLVINKFRGDPGILAPGLAALERRTRVPVLGVVPHLDGWLLPAEDGLDLDGTTGCVPPAAGAIDIAVARLPRIANFDDLDPLAREPGVRVRFVQSPAGLVGADLLMLPGSKQTLADLTWLRASGLADALVAAARRGTPILGICGGFQMLGRTLHDPDGLEGGGAERPGLGLLPVVTTFAAPKTTVRVRARVTAHAGLLGGARGVAVEGYEIHHGRTVNAGALAPLEVQARGGLACAGPEGALAAGGTVVGTYLHGLLASDGVRRAVLGHLASRRGRAPDPRWGAPQPAAARYERVADAVATAIDVGAIAKIAGL
jgi:adenosylcobyric acid synthase